MLYKCENCGKEIEVDMITAKKIICQYCGYRILKKTRPEIVKKVNAI
jgi:DNA-directed RNA polymerase subunit RPC12/RpoP